MSKRLYIGCVADDFTGAADGASFLRRAGLSTVLINGIPENELGEIQAQAVVIALKSRTEEREKAVQDSLQAFRWLKEKGAEILYFKYCSTFDSTDQGNIGPVIDQVLETMEFPYTVLCPSLPVNGRTVKDGKLYVNGVLLEESHMKDHPLTPMRRSRIAELMQVQGKYDCLETKIPPEQSLQKIIREKLDGGGHCYVVPDYETDLQGQQIVEAFSKLQFYTGGSGLLEHLGKKYGDGHAVDRDEKKRLKNLSKKVLLLAGSCSRATLEQIEDYKLRGLPFYQILPERVVVEQQTAEEIWEEAGAEEKEVILLYSSASPQEVEQSQDLGKERVSEALEAVMARLALKAREQGITKFVVAGGETSGAVLKALGYQAYRIGKSIAPGVPVLKAVGSDPVELVPKSGNFGQKDFFVRAIMELFGNCLSDREKNKGNIPKRTEVK